MGRTVTVEKLIVATAQAAGARDARGVARRRRPRGAARRAGQCRRTPLTPADNELSNRAGNEQKAVDHVDQPQRCRQLLRAPLRGRTEKKKNKKREPGEGAGRGAGKEGERAGAVGGEFAARAQRRRTDERREARRAGRKRRLRASAPAKRSPSSARARARPRPPRRLNSEHRSLVQGMEENGHQGLEDAREWDGSAHAVGERSTFNEV